MAMQDPALMNAILAVSASHHSRWQSSKDTISRKYLREALRALGERFADPVLISTPTTLAVMLCLISFEVFSGSNRWISHHEAIRGWVRTHGDCVDVDPFLKNWVCMIDTQFAMNSRHPAMVELGPWMETNTGSSGKDHSIDALFGCSVKLPALMVSPRLISSETMEGSDQLIHYLDIQWSASQLHAESSTGPLSAEEIVQQAEALQEKIRSTAMATNSNPAVAIMCSKNTPCLFSAIVGLDKEDLRRRMVATAEIFRHAAHIYVYRIAHGPGIPLSPTMQESLEAALDLLTAVPDAIGPGANLGWCLVVIGAELDLPDQRDYIRSRWPGMHLLGMYNSKQGQQILEEVWAYRDLVTCSKAPAKQWQDVMGKIGACQILV